MKPLDPPTAVRLARPGLLVGAGGLIVAGGALALFAHPAWAVLTVIGGLALIAVPDPTNPPRGHTEE